MTRSGTLSIAAAALLWPTFAAPAALAQSIGDLSGTWTLVSSDRVNPDGARTPTLGPHPTGQLVFTKDGQFIWLFLSTDLPKFASNNRAAGTPEENAAIVRGSIAVFGTYALAGKNLVFKIEHSTFPNWTGAEQKRTITSITGAELKWTNPVGSTGGVAELAFKRSN